MSVFNKFWYNNISCSSYCHKGTGYDEIIMCILLVVSINKKHLQLFCKIIDMSYVMWHVICLVRVKIWGQHYWLIIVANFNPLWTHTWLTHKISSPKSDTLLSHDFWFSGFSKILKFNSFLALHYNTKIEHYCYTKHQNLCFLALVFKI